MKKIEVTVGYRIEEENADTKYFQGRTNEGFVYKDEKAFKEHKGIAYIPESVFDNEKDHATEDDGYFYTYQDFRNLVEIGAKECEDYPKIKDKEAFLESLASGLFSASEWCSPETLIDDWDFEEDVDEWLTCHQ